MHPCSLHSRSAEENCPTGNVLSRPSVKGAAPPCAANAAIPCGHVSKFEHNVLEVLIWTKKLMIARADVQTDYKLHISFRLAFIHFAIAHKRKSPETLRFQDLGGDKRDRTADLLNAIGALSRSSSSPLPSGRLISNKIKATPSQNGSLNRLTIWSP